jgi:ribose 5-phosphate isomerase B
MIIVSADHQGRAIQEDLCQLLKKLDLDFKKVGEELYSTEDDYPDFARVAVGELFNAQQNGEEDAKAILLCGSGQGMVIAANRFRGIRAGLCWDVSEATLARSDDDINVLCLPARSFGDNNGDSWQDIVKAFLETGFKNAPRYARRKEKLDRLP